jgi:hypothetical protein
MMDTPKSPLQIGPLIPFCCEYRKPDGIYGITLYGLTPEQVIEDNCAELADLKVLGVLHEIIPCDTPRNPEPEDDE